MSEIILTDESFQSELEKKHNLFVVDLWAEWCMPCRMIAPILEELAQKYSDKMVLGKLNVDDYPSVAQQYGVTGIPTVLIFKNGELVDKIVGALPKKMFEKKFQSFFD